MRKLFFLFLTTFLLNITFSFGQFGPKHIIANVTSPGGTLVGAFDIDCDGDEDILINHSGCNIACYYNEGNGIFGPHTYLIEGQAFSSKVYIYDIDDDSDMDLIIVPGSGDILLYKNDGYGNFNNQEIIISNVNDMKIGIADIDGDGDKDIVTQTYSIGTCWHKNDGTGYFYDSVCLNNGGNYGGYFRNISDIDNDGDNDLILYVPGQYSNQDKIVWYINDGNGNFGTSQIMVDNLDYTVNYIGIGDINGDTYNDIIFSYQFLHELKLSLNDGFNIFGAPSNITNESISDYSEITIYDFDGDNDVDIIMGNNIYINTGNPGYWNKINSYGNKLSDIDNDGDLDIVSEYFNNGLCWFENLDNGYFALPYEVCDGSGDILASGDIDGDLDNDILFPFNNKIYWAENDSLGTFINKTLIHSSSNSLNSLKSVFLNDIDYDSDLDIIIGLNASSNDSIYWFENDGSGSFINKNLVSYSFHGLECVITGDIDGDLDDDIIAAYSTDDKIVWWENDGIGNFVNQHFITSAYVPKSIFCTDFDGDNDDDILFTSNADSKIGWFENDGTGTFLYHNFANTTDPYYIYAEDFDGDNDKDVIYSTHISFNNGSIEYCENGGFGNIISTKEIGYPHNITYFTCTDIDHDNDYDIITSYPFGTNQTLGILRNNGNGDFEITSPLTFLEIGYQKILSEDLDNDGFEEILCAGYYFKNDSAVMFKQPFNIDYTSSGYAWTYKAISGDINSDGNVDFVTNSYASYFKNNGNKEFFKDQLLQNENIPQVEDWVLADIDNDNDSDLVLISTTSAANLRKYINDGNGNFENIDNTYNSMHFDYITSVDLDSDGDNDILGFHHINNRVSWCENDGLGNFTFHIITSSVPNIRSVYPYDIDNDGDIDFLADKYLFTNNGSQGFVSTQILTPSYPYIYKAEVVDINNDGFKDILTVTGDTYYPIRTCWFENDGIGNYNIIHIVDSIIPFLTTEDFDSDGDYDIMCKPTSAYIKYYENDGIGNFESHLILVEANAGTGIAVDIDNDGDKDFFGDGIFWIENFYGSALKIKGNIFYDEDQNGVKDSVEQGLSSIHANISQNTLASYSNNSGYYWFAVDTGNYHVYHDTVMNWNLTSPYPDFNVIIDTANPFVDTCDFGFYPEIFITQIEPNLTINHTRCSEVITSWINFKNIGTTQPRGIVELKLDNLISFDNSSIPPDSIIGNNVYWSYDSLFFFQEDIIPITVQMPDFSYVGDTLISFLNIYTIDSLGSIEYNFSDTLSRVLFCSIDPNDKIVDPVGIGINGYINKNQILEYTIRFQNTGNDTAINVMIRDKINGFLDIATFNPLASSHPMNVHIEPGNTVVFELDSIMLPDSISNEIESHGFVKFSISPIQNIDPLTPITNSAEIYFDINPPTYTDTTINTIECYSIPLPPDINLIQPYLFVSSTDNIQWFLNDSILFGETDTTYFPLINGDYTVLVTDIYGCSALSDVFVHTTVGIPETELELVISVNPNPFNEYTTIEFSEILGEEFELVIYNLLGSELKRYSEIKSNKLVIHKSELSSGIYLGKLFDSKNRTKIGTVKLLIN